VDPNDHAGLFRDGRDFLDEVRVVVPEFALGVLASVVRVWCAALSRSNARAFAPPGSARAPCSRRRWPCARRWCRECPPCPGPGGTVCTPQPSHPARADSGPARPAVHARVAEPVDLEAGLLEELAPAGEVVVVGLCTARPQDDVFTPICRANWRSASVGSGASAARPSGHPEESSGHWHGAWAHRPRPRPGPVPGHPRTGRSRRARIHGGSGSSRPLRLQVGRRS